MKLTEFQAKQLLAARGVPIPAGRLVSTPDDAAAAAEALGGQVAVKAQVRSGGRGKAGGVVVVSDAEEARDTATRLLGAELNGEMVTELLIEEAVDIAAERYLSVMIDPSAGRPLLMQSDQGGVEIESMTEGIDRTLIPADGYDGQDAFVAAVYEAFCDLEALLVEINPLAVTAAGDLIALDAKIELDDAAAYRQDHPASAGVEGTDREQQAAELGLRLIELGGDIAVLGNTRVRAGVKSLLVNFCGAFARCDVMTAGVIEALEAIKPDLPINFRISGTGQDEAEAMVRAFGHEPHPSMESAVRAAVAAVGDGSADNSVGDDAASAEAGR